MKLLDWMNQKLRKSSIEPFKDFKIGSCCTCISPQPLLDNPKCYPKSKPSKQFQSKCSESFCELTKNRADEDLQEESSLVVPELFHGFLAIGTFGLEPTVTEPGTPTFGVSSKNIIEKETEVTENELKLISNELEKFLVAEAEEGSRESSGRNSFVVLNSKQMEGAHCKQHEKLTICPLQHYLFGSTKEFPDSEDTVKERGSLRELFKKTDKYSTAKIAEEDMQAKEKKRFNKRLMKKMLKKIQTSARISTTSASGNTADFIAKKKKLNKVLQIFHRKIHPESPTTTKEFNQSFKHQSSIPDDGNILPQNEDSRKLFQGSDTKDAVQNHKTSSLLSQSRLVSSTSIGNKEHWITTDTDYLVLEL